MVHVVAGLMLCVVPQVKTDISQQEVNKGTFDHSQKVAVAVMTEQLLPDYRAGKLMCLRSLVFCRETSKRLYVLRVSLCMW